jgi:hypothetical protein
VIRRIVLHLAGASLVLLAGCGGSGDKASGDRTFDVEGIGVTFRYPATFKPIGNVTFSQSAGAKPKARAGVRLDRVNAIVVSRYDLRATITKKNLADFKAEVDGVIRRLAGQPVAGREVEYGGLPGYEYVISLQTPPNGRSRLAVLFAGATEYLVNCQSTPGKRQAVAAACRHALDTLKTK